MTHGRLGVVRKSIQVAFELINRPENRDKWEKGFTCFFVDVGTTFPEDILEHSLPYIITLLEADVCLYIFINKISLAQSLAEIMITDSITDIERLVLPLCKSNSNLSSNKVKV